jgi:hypothetical protein
MIRRRDPTELTQLASSDPGTVASLLKECKWRVGSSEEFTSRTSELIASGCWRREANLPSSAQSGTALQAEALGPAGGTPRTFRRPAAVADVVVRRRILLPNGAGNCARMPAGDRLSAVTIQSTGGAPAPARAVVGASPTTVGRSNESAFSDDTTPSSRPAGACGLCHFQYEPPPLRKSFSTQRKEQISVST